MSEIPQKKNQPKVFVPKHRKKFFIGTPVQKIFLFYSVTMGFLSILLMRVHDYILMVVGERSLVTAVTVGVFIIFVSYIAVGLFLSNRIAGPLYRIEDSLKKYLETGEYSEIKLREGDLFSGLADLVNKAISKTKS
ncbi:MAG: hypothetical protein WCH11_01365 [Bdellovibrio sp.]